MTEKIKISADQVCVLLPTYCGSQTLRRTLQTLAEQTVRPTRLYVRDDTPSELVDERSSIRSIVDDFGACFDIKFIENQVNLGYPKNLAKLVEESEEELIFLLAQDDLLSPIAIESSLRALRMFPRAGAIVRPYYWFDSDPHVAVRAVQPLNENLPVVVSTTSPWVHIQHTLFAAGQLTGLMFHRSAIRVPVIDSVFPAHVAPIAGILRDFGVVFIPEVTVAVSIRDSQTRFLSSIYSESPTVAWITMYEKIFGPVSESKISRLGQRVHMGKNFVGLIQIRVHGSIKWFFRECLLLIRCRPLNLIDPRFYFFAIGLTILPRTITRRVTDLYKSQVLRRRLVSWKLTQSSST
jgi:hypothetical protein